MLRGSNYFSSLICSHNSELWIYGNGSISSSFSGMIQLTQGKKEISLSGQEVSVLIHIYIFSSVHSLSRDQLFATPWTAACQASLSITNSQSLLKLMSIELVMQSISSSVIPFSCLQSFPLSGSFPRSQFFASGGQSIGVSGSAAVLPVNVQG